MSSSGGFDPHRLTASLTRYTLFLNGVGLGETHQLPQAAKLIGVSVSSVKVLVGPHAHGPTVSTA
jgi:hypothetical protein